MEFINYFIIAVTLLYQLCIVKGTGDDLKSSLVFVIDDTGSMSDDIEQVKLGANTIFDTVMNSNESQIENFILVTFNDPDVRLPTVTRDRNVFKQALNNIEVDGGDDCPEYSMSGIERALEESLPRSYLYVFTDASAKDYKKYEQVKSLSQKMSCQVVFVLTGTCSYDSDSADPDYQVYYKLAKATSGQVFHLGKTDVREILDYVIETIKGRRTLIASKDFPPGYGHKFNYTVDGKIKDVLISVSGSKPKVNVTDHEGSTPDIEHIVDKDKIAVVKVTGTKPGTYTAEVGSKSKTSAVVTGRTVISFQYGFSTFKPSSITDTATRPAPDVKSYISIKLNVGEGGDVKLVTLDVLDMDGNVVAEMSLEVVDEKQRFYITKEFDPPKTMFRIRIAGYDVETKTLITRMAPTPIEPQNPAVEKKENKGPTVTIEGDSKINAEYDEPLQLKCKVNAYPKPDIIWEETDTGMVLSTTVSTVELPYNYISILDLEKVNKNNTYLCKAKNEYGSDNKYIAVETKRRIFFNVMEHPKDTSIEYEKEGTLVCKIDAFPPATISWYRKGNELVKDDNVDISVDKSVVTIKNMQLYLKGSYMCEARNEFNRKVFKFDVAMSGAESPKIDKNVSDINVVKGSSADIWCRIIQGKPTPKIRWFFKHNSDGRFIELKESEDKIRLKKAHPNKSGIYRCVAANMLGRDMHEIDLDVEYPPTIKEGERTIRAKEGEEITLTCEVDGYPTPNVNWFKDGSLFTPTKSVHLYRDHTLRLTVSLEDRGNYSCTAANKLGVAKTFVLVDVFVPVNIEPPKISTIEVKIGGRVKLPCRADGYPKPEVKWIFYSVDPKIPPKITNASDISLSKDLYHIQLNEQGFYTCVASNIGGSVNISYEIKVNAPPIIENIYTEKTFRVVEGDLVLRVQCNATGQPKPTVTWIKDGLNIASGSEWYDIEEDGTILIKNIDNKSEGTYVCQAKNRFGVDTEIYDVVVERYPQPGPPTTTVLLEEGKSLAVKCDVPRGIFDSLRWYKDKYLISNNQLTIYNATLSDSGLYTCRVSDFFKSRTGNTRVKVGFKPRFTTVEEENIDLEEGITALLVCEAKAEPPPRISWWHNGKKLDVPHMIHMFEMNLSDEGKYVCVVANDFGNIYRTFNIKSRDCVLSVDKEFTGNQPLMIAQSTNWPSFKTIDGNMRIPRDEYVSLICPSKFTLFPKSYVMAFCEGESNFRINGNIYKYSDIKCTEEINPVVIETRRKCLGDRTQTVKIMYKVLDGYLEAYDVCLNNDTKMPHYAKQRIKSSVANVAPKNATWIKSNLQPFYFDDLYNCDLQIETITSNLGKWFHSDDRCCFSMRQLVNPRDMTPGLAQTATYNFLNVVPHWSSCTTMNWNDVEQRIRNLVKTIDYHLTIWTGTAETLELPNSYSLMKDVHISDREKRKQPVPKYLWKVIQDSVARSSLAIIQLNIPDLTLAEASKHVLCNDICKDVRWMRSPEWHDVTKGYTYCCKLHEFVAMLGYDRVFEAGHENILYDVSSISEHALT